MKILVTAKRVTDPELKIKVKDDGTGIDMTGITFKLNPFDEIAVEEALRLKEKLGGEVVLASIGPEESQTEIRSGLAMGADRAVLVINDGYLESSAAAQVFKKIVEDEQPDIVLMGKQAVDDDANQCGQMLAYHLGWGQACFASEITIDGAKATVKREVDGGIETVETELPAVITADLRLNEPRYASLPGIMKAKKKEIKKIPIADTGVDITQKLNILSMENPPSRGGACKLFDNVDALIDALKNEAKAI